jgi:choline dehydrogenase-like flavoprotein
VTGVEVKRGDLSETFTADIVVVACGALSSALLLLRSANDAHPDGLANGSGQVGRNYMRHNQSVLMALSRERNDTVFQKTLALTDWYFGAHDYEFPMGLVQMCAATHSAQIKGEALPAWLEWLPNVPFEQMAKHSMDFWLSSEDLPLAENRICYQDGKVVLEFTETNMQAHRQLRKKLQAAVQSFGMHPKMVDRNIYFGMDIPLAGTSHQAGTARFGSDPAVSVLDLNCKAHELDNLYLADASFFPSIGAVNPTLTIVANAMRVADHLKARLAA